MLFIVGPSHVTRWRHVIERANYPAPSSEIVYAGDGGYPVWSKASREKVRKRYRPGDTILLIVGDFRFGNKRIEDEAVTKSDLFADGYTHIDKRLITTVNDVWMKSLSIAALLEWKAEFGDDVIIFHWSLAMQAIQNRLEGRFVGPDGHYHHPSWNIGEFEFFANSIDGIVDFATDDANRLKSLFIDKDLHPSPLGFLYMNEIVRTRNHREAFSSAFKTYREAFQRLFASFESRPKTRVAIFGDSYFNSVLERAIPLEFRRALTALGVFVLDFPRSAGLLYLQDQKLDEIIFVTRESLSASPEVFDNQIRTLREKYRNVAKKVSVFPWETVFELSYRRRGGYPVGRLTPLSSGEQSSLKAAIDLDYAKLIENGDVDTMIDHGAGGAPTLNGIFYLLSVLAGVSNHIEPFPRVMSEA